jgi:hypothetical protein
MYYIRNILPWVTDNAVCTEYIPRITDNVVYTEYIPWVTDNVEYTEYIPWVTDDDRKPVVPSMFLLIHEFGQFALS